MHPESTYGLTINCRTFGNLNPAQVKERVKSWLFQNGEPAFVEGVVDGLDLDFDYENEGIDYYEDLGGNQAPLVIYRYDQDHLNQLSADLVKEFGASVDISISKLLTQGWMEGWKESFKPFSTKKFYVYPPWCSGPIGGSLMPILVEPGMAFGTGQHATTQLCLQEIEKQDFSKILHALDVGTGTGILSIGMKLMGCKEVVATDIDPDAIIACRDNAQANGLKFAVEQMSVPEEGSFNLVVANILFVVIKRILDQLVDRMSLHGSLLLSGVLEEESQEMNAIAVSKGLELVRQNNLNGWVSLLYRKIS